MADKLSTMTRAKWDTLKKDAKIPTTSAFKTLLGGAANVGKAIDDYQTARADWKAFKSINVVSAYVKALDHLNKAFIKFAAIKEFKTPEAKELATAIKEWQKAATDKKTKVLKFAADNKEALKANDTALLIDTLTKNGMM